MGSDLETRIRHVTAVLGPTNTGKTHLAIERMLGHESGMIGLPLRLLAREVYDKIANRVGADKVALITGEEKIKPERARYWVCTVEAMPRDIDVDFLAIDEIQLAGDPERGHVFTDRLLHARGRSETLLLGAQTMREAIADLIPGANFISRPRLSKLSYSGQKKITRLPQRTAVVAFSATEVYAIAELIRRQHGGAAVVLGALSPRTRNAQVALYQSGDVEFLVATDAIGMGLNLDVDHVAFSATRKFDGQNHRNLTPSELSQIAGRAGRHMNDGTFGVTGGAEPLDNDTIERLETHNFDSVRVLQWRNRDLDTRTLEGLKQSLREMPNIQRLVRARSADDVIALETMSADRDIAAMATAPAAVGKLWEVCQIPDYRKISGQNHAELVASIYGYLMSDEERIPEDWFAKQVGLADRTDGDIDTLANRIAHIRTWTFVSNRAAWLKDPEHWQGKTREIEDRLSDAMHEQLTQRFVDRRTSALMKGMRDKDELHAEIAADGAINVENHFVGRLRGFRFQLDPGAEGIHGKATRSAAAQVLARELGMRARRVAAAQPDALSLDRRGRIMWREEELAQIEATDDPLKPTVSLLVDEHLSGPDREKVQARLDAWLEATISGEVEAAGRDQQGGGHRRAGARHCLPAAREPRCAASRDGRRGDQVARPECARAATQVRGALRRLQHLLPGAAQAGSGGTRADALVAEERGRQRTFRRRAAGAATRRSHVVRARPGLPRSLLPGLRLSRVRSARGAPRHARAPRRSDPPAIGVARHQRCDAAKGRSRRWWVHRHSGDDVAARLLAGRAWRRAEGAGLPSRSPAGQDRCGDGCKPAGAECRERRSHWHRSRACRGGTCRSGTCRGGADRSRDRPLPRPRPVRLPKALPMPLRWKRSTRISGVRAGISAASAAPTAASATGSAPPIAHLPRLPRLAQTLLQRPARRQATSLPMQAREEKPDRKEDRRPHGRERGGERDRNREAGQHRRSQQTERRPRRDDRREDPRRKAEVHTAAPPRRGGADPDSPFAALSALRDELAKRGKETST